MENEVKRLKEEAQMLKETAHTPLVEPLDEDEDTVKIDDIGKNAVTLGYQQSSMGNNRK